MFPSLQINLTKLTHNVATLVALCQENQIKTIFGVTKVLAGDQLAIDAMIKGGITHLADSRIENLRRLKDLALPKVLVRLPMTSEVDEVVRIADISLNSEIETIRQLNQAAEKQNTDHGIILMFDLGDLREGIWFESDYLSLVTEILTLKHIHLKGIGTNLTCYGGVIPTPTNLSQLLTIKTKIESYFNIQLEIISGGNTSSLHLLYKNILPAGINNLRLGEGFFLGRETAYEADLKALYQDVFELQAEIIELKEKPSIPIGEIGVDAFGHKPSFTDKGTIIRAIVGIGKQDVYPSNIEPIDPEVIILGSSSDHLILDVTKGNYKLGDLVRFKLSYGGLLQSMTSPYVKKQYVE
jgi:predicted amino acid racemase